MTHEEMLLSYLRKYAGIYVPFWTPINFVADEIVGHDRRFSPVARWKRHRMRTELSVDMNRLIAQGKVIRTQKLGKDRNKVRINEALVQNRSLIH